MRLSNIKNIIDDMLNSRQNGGVSKQKTDVVLKPKMVRLPPELWKRVRAKAAAAGKTVQVAVAEALREWVK